MRALLTALALWLLGLWIWRSVRGALRTHQSGSAPQRRTASDTQTTLACSHCGLHVPSSEAVMGARGGYCCEEHRQLAER